MVNRADATIDFLDLGPDLANLGDHLFVSFTTQRLKSPRIAWLNERWWLNKGVNLANKSARLALESWILRNYAFCVPEEHLHSYLETDEKQFLADRYGATGGTFHGGSGRCGISGMLNVKGIGRTPLVNLGEHIDWVHSHGCVWIEEAVREAIASEIAAAELPYGAVPTVAIIDCGIEANASFGRRRALIVRPNFVRIAHLERSVYFGTAGHSNSDQYQDALRVDDAFRRTWGDDQRRTSLDIETSSLSELVTRISRQLAYGYSARLFIGGISSSNLTLNGEVVDFGLFSSVYNWERTSTQLTLAAFGEEYEDLCALIRSVAFFQHKYLGIQENVDNIATQAAEDISRYFGESLSANLYDGRLLGRVARRSIEKIFRSYFAQQNKTRRLLRDPGHRSWIGPYLGAPQSRQDLATREFAVTLRSALGPKEGVREEIIWRSLRRLSQPRPWLHWDRLDYRASRFAQKHLPSLEFPKEIDSFINEVLSRSRRIWPRIPETCVVLAQATSTCSSALSLEDLVSGEQFLQLESTSGAGVSYLFGVASKAIDLPPPSIDHDTTIWRVKLAGPLSRYLNQLRSQGLDIPKLQSVAYNQLDNREH